MESSMEKEMTAFKAWFIFVAFLAICLIAGGVYAVYLLFAHFGVIA